MFCAIYEFEVPLDKLDEFKDIWHNLTLLMRETRDGLGSRLHKDIKRDNIWIAYAQWPNKEKWDESAPLNATIQTALSARIKAICTNIQTLYQLDVIDDLLVK